MSRWVIRELGLLTLTTCWRAIPPSSEGLLLHTAHPQLFCLPDLKVLTAHPDLNFCSLQVHLGAWRACPVLTSCPGALQVYHWAVVLGSALSGYDRSVLGSREIITVSFLSFLWGNWDKFLPLSQHSRNCSLAGLYTDWPVLLWPWLLPLKWLWKHRVLHWAATAFKVNILFF